MKKKLLSIILAIAMLACMIPLSTMTAFARNCEDVTITNPILWDDGSVKSLTVTFDWNPSGNEHLYVAVLDEHDESYNGNNEYWYQYNKYQHTAPNSIKSSIDDFAKYRGIKWYSYGGRGSTPTSGYNTINVSFSKGDVPLNVDRNYSLVMFNAPGGTNYRPTDPLGTLKCDSSTLSFENTSGESAEVEIHTHNFVDGICTCGEKDAATKLAEAKTVAIAEINAAKTDDNKAVAEKAITDINAATNIDDVAAIKTQALTDMAKADADAAAQRLADAKTAAKEAIDTAVGEDTSKNVTDAAKAAKTAIDAETVTTIEAVNNIKTAAVALIGNLKAFNAEKVTQTAAAEALAADGDSEAATALITKAKEDIAGLAYDETKTLDENKAALAAIVTKLGTDLAAQRLADAKTAAKEAIDTAVGEDTAENVKAAAKTAKDAIDAETVTTIEAVNDIKTAAVTLIGNLKAFNTEAANQIAAVEAMAEENDSTVSQKLITDAEAEIVALTYDEGKSLNDNKAAIAAIVTKLGTDLAAQRLADAKTAAKEEILAALPENASEELKNTAASAIERILQAENLTAVNEIKTAAISEIKNSSASFRCPLCPRYEEEKDIPFYGFILSIVHLFIHMVYSIGRIS